MTAHRIPSRGLTALRAACKNAFSYYYEGKRPKTQREQDDAVKAIGIQLDLALAAAPEVHSVDEIAAIVFTAPGIDHAFIQHTASLDKEAVSKVPGGAGAQVFGYPLRDTYRVFIHTGKEFKESGPKTFTEESGPDLLACIRAAFKTLNLPLPAGIPEP